MRNELQHTQGRVVVSLDMNYKDVHRFEDGTEIKLVRRVNNLDRKHTEPVNATVISAKDIPVGAEILIHPNSNHDTNRIFNHKTISGKDISAEINYYSIPENECYFWRMGIEDWQPCSIYASALRVFQPYTGILEGIEPTKIADVLYVTSGDYKGQVVKTLRACDYELIFNDSDHREHRLLRFRPHGDYTADKEAKHREPEAICILHELTGKVNEGKLLVGLSKSDCKPLKETVNV